MGSNRQRVFAAIICLVFFVYLNAQAKDFGVVGHTYEIAEQDIVEYIKHRLQEMDQEALQKEMQDKVKASVERPKAVEDITTAKENKTFYYDPTYVLGEDLKDHEGRIIHKKGYTINPLKEVRFPSDLIFIDGDDERQINYAVQESSKKQASEKQVKIVLVKGSPLELQKKHKVWIYFDQFGFLTSKLGIKHVPAVVSQEGLRLKIEEIEPEKAGSQGHILAQHSIGRLLYEEGKKAEAREWWKKAEKQGQSEAIFNLKKLNLAQEKSNIPPKELGEVERPKFLCAGDLEDKEGLEHCSTLSAEEIKALRSKYLKYREILKEYFVKNNYKGWDKKADKDVPLNINEVAIALLHDIDGDGEEEILFNIFEPGYCGSAGCSFNILKKNKEGEWLLVATFNTWMDNIFISRSNKPLGYKDFIFLDKWDSWIILKWNGERCDFDKKIL